MTKCHKPLNVLTVQALAILSLLLAAVLPAAAQVPLRDLPKYSFIDYKANHIRFDTVSGSYQHLLRRLQRVDSTGVGNINVLHIGGSHVQAGTLPNRVRRNLLAAFPSMRAGRGMIFPYSAAAKCNNPPDYKVSCREKMELTRNVHKPPAHPLGVCGIAVTAHDTVSTIGITLCDSGVDYATQHIIVFGYSGQGVVPNLSVCTPDGSQRKVQPSYIDPATRRFIFNLSRPVDSFSVVLPCRNGEDFTLTGIYLGNRRSGLTYHSIGVNGAALPDYLERCPHFTQDLRLLRPDLVICGIGINDASGPNFDTAQFHLNYMRLVDSIRSVNPDCAFIFITNNDSYRRVSRRNYHVNHNGPLVREAVNRIARQADGVVWDQFEVMGGLKSMEQWRKAKLAQYDRVHFTRAGYELVADLLSNAILESYNKYLEHQRLTKHKQNSIPAADERYRYISY
ncbi:MAG: hypothetical protein K5650_04605 [Bacteroidales bacterium]|nr:hypothetical protein [Bacteroidales bacterium]